MFPSHSILPVGGSSTTQNKAKVLSSVKVRVMMMAMPMAMMMTMDQSLGRQWFLFLHHFIAALLLILII